MLLGSCFSRGLLGGGKSDQTAAASLASSPGLFPSVEQTFRPAR
jgi:hypothetical protein